MRTIVLTKQNFRMQGACSTRKCISSFLDLARRFKDQSTIREVRALLIKHAAQPDMDEADEHKGLQLSQFEMAQLANLSITDIDEARTLIPTYVYISSH